ncbi:MAG: hypothetical protein IPL40_12370 [Proteobacteria bacterium]|nr:hypothetical protein [Pseudomonadota bacterium]
MLQRAQSLVEQVRAQVRTTLRVVVDLAQSLGVPPGLTAMLTGEASEPARRPCVPPKDSVPPKDGAAPNAAPPAWRPRGSAVAAAASPSAPSVIGPSGSSSAQRASAATGAPEAARAPARRPSRKVALEGDRGRSSQVRMLHAEDAINGSTYLARIIWSLGVARLEGLGPLRPADMARIIMARSPVSLEPPNVARYIRRSHPTSIAVDHSEGSSHFYKLTAEGQSLFENSFGAS